MIKQKKEIKNNKGKNITSVYCLFEAIRDGDFQTRYHLHHVAKSIKSCKDFISGYLFVKKCDDENIIIDDSDYFQDNIEDGTYKFAHNSMDLSNDLTYIGERSNCKEYIEKGCNYFAGFVIEKMKLE